MISLNDVTMMSEVHPKVAVIEISVDASICIQMHEYTITARPKPEPTTIQRRLAIGDITILYVFLLRCCILGLGTSYPSIPSNQTQT